MRIDWADGLPEDNLRYQAAWRILSRYSDGRLIASDLPWITGRGDNLRLIPERALHPEVIFVADDEAMAVLESASRIALGDDVPQRLHALIRDSRIRQLVAEWLEE